MAKRKKESMVLCETYILDGKDKYRVYHDLNEERFILFEIIDGKEVKKKKADSPLKFKEMYMLPDDFE